MFKDKVIKSRISFKPTLLFFILLIITTIWINYQEIKTFNKVRGWVDHYGDSHVKGWLCVKDADNNKIMLEISVDDKLVGYTQRSQHRIDISDRNYPECLGQAYIGFELSFTPIPGNVLNIRIIDLQTNTNYWLKSFTNVFKKMALGGNDYKNPLNTYRIQFKLMRDDIKRVHVMIPAFNKDMTGGPLSILRFLNRYARFIQFNLMLTTLEGLSPEELRNHLLKYNELDDLKYVNIQRFTEQVSFSYQDTCMATIYYTMYTCLGFLNQIGSNKPPLYFIQDYETIFFPGGSNWIEAENSYKYPHFAIYSTTFLYEYFKTRTDLSPLDSYVAQPAIKISTTTHISTEKVLFVYARPHSDRNAFDFTMLLIQKLIEDKILNKDWELIGVGSLPGVSNININNHVIKMVNNIPEPEYFKLLTRGSIAISLMLTPHSSLPPLDFAKNGMLVLTNTFWTKTKDSFQTISKNILASDLKMESLTSNFKILLSRIDDIDGRTKGSILDWAGSWDSNSCYGSTLFLKLKKWIE